MYLWPCMLDITQQRIHSSTKNILLTVLMAFQYNRIVILCTYLQTVVYTNTIFVFLSHADVAKSSMQERIRYEDDRLQKGIYVATSTLLKIIRMYSTCTIIMCIKLTFNLQYMYKVKVKYRVW